MAEVGCDVASEWVDIAVDGKVSRVARTQADLDGAFSQLPAHSRILMEPTGRYHRLVVERAKKADHDVKLVDPYAFSLYRRSLNSRACTDKISALALARYAGKEWDHVPEHKPLPKDLQRLKDLLQLRETQTNLRVALQQAITEVKAVPGSSKRALKALERSVKDLDLAIFAIAKKDPLYDHFIEMDGIGPVCAPMLVWLFRAFRFVNSDQVVAFAGLDVRVRESGKYRGQRKLTKRGLPLIRHLLCCAASSLRVIAHFKPLFAKHHAKGIKAKGVNVILARRILRAAFEIASKQARYSREKFYTP